MQRFTLLILSLLVAFTQGQNTCAANTVDQCDQYCCNSQTVSDPTVAAQCNCNGDDSRCPSGFKCCGNQCYSSDLSACCEYKDNALNTQKSIYDKDSEQCCKFTGPRDKAERCPCRDKTSDDCSSNAGDIWGATACCNTILDSDDAADVNTVLRGVCYNPSDSKREACCEGRHFKTVNIGGFANSDKIIYNPMNQKCCKVDGIIDSDQFCRCHEGADCSESTTCCRPQEFKNGVTKCSQHCRSDNLVMFNNKQVSGNWRMCEGQCLPKGFKCTENCGIIEEHEDCCGYEDNNGQEQYEKYNTRTQKCCGWTTKHRNLPGYAGIQGKLGAIDIDDRCPCNDDNSCAHGGVCCKTNKDDDLGVCTLEREGCCKRESTLDNVLNDVIYNTEDQICCMINGVQNPSVVDDFRKCVCTEDSHCPTGGACCVNQMVKDDGVWSEKYLPCSADYYGNGNAVNGQCYGRCINTEFESCCGKNGNVCYDEYQECCADDTEAGDCCNKRTEACHKHRVTWKKYDDADQEMCTKKEHWTPTIVYYSFVFPILLSLISIGLFIPAAINALSSEGDRIATLVLLVVSILALLVGVLVLFSPVWKYALVSLIANIVILNACHHESGHWTRKFALFLAVITFLFVIDPFSGNALLSFHSWTPTQDSNPDGNGAGLQWASRALLYNAGKVGGDYDHTLCINYYNFFVFDNANHEDYRHHNDQEGSWGFCKLGWLHAIGVMSGLLIIFEVLIILIAIALIPRKGIWIKDEKTGQVVPIQDPSVNHA